MNYLEKILFSFFTVFFISSFSFSYDNDQDKYNYSAFDKGSGFSISDFNKRQEALDNLIKQQNLQNVNFNLPTTNLNINQNTNSLPTNWQTSDLFGRSWNNSISNIQHNEQKSMQSFTITSSMNNGLNIIKDFFNIKYDDHARVNQFSEKMVLDNTTFTREWFDPHYENNEMYDNYSKDLTQARAINNRGLIAQLLSQKTPLKEVISEFKEIHRQTGKEPVQYQIKDIQYDKNAHVLTYSADMRDSNGDMLNVGVSITRDKAGSILSLLIKMSDNKGFNVTREWNTNSPEKLSQALKILLQNKIPIVVEDTDFTQLKDLQIVKTLILEGGQSFHRIKGCPHYMDEEKKLTEVNSTHSTALRVDTEQGLILSNVSISDIIKNIATIITTPPIQLIQTIDQQETEQPSTNTTFMRKIVQSYATFTGFAGKSCYDTTISYYTSDDGKQIVKADMALDWVNFYEDKVEIIGDVLTLAAFANIRWSKAVNNAVPKVAELINSGKYNIIEIPGINSSGLTKEQLMTVAQNIHLQPNQTLVIAHSAGTEAVAKAMPLITRNKEEVFYLILSPRMAPKTFASWMQKGEVKPNHVLSINSLYDYPHWANKFLSLPRQFWHNYDKHPSAGIHAFVFYDYMKERKLGHGSMFESLYNNHYFNIKINGISTIKEEKIPDLINDFIKGQYRR